MFSLTKDAHDRVYHNIPGSYGHKGRDIYFEYASDQDRYGPAARPIHCNRFIMKYNTNIPREAMLGRYHGKT